MNKILLLAATLSLAATRAFAVGGIDLSSNGCPGSPPAIGGETGPLDCARIYAGHSYVSIVGTWAPAEAIHDLIGLDAQLTAEVGGSRAVNGFWDFDTAPGHARGCNAAAGGFNAYLDPLSWNQCIISGPYYPTWSESVPGRGISWQAIGTGPATQSFAISLFRVRPTSVIPEQNLFGFEITIIGYDDYPIPGPTCDGCSAPFCITWNVATPQAASTTQVTSLTGPTGNFPGFSQRLSFNGGNALCAAVPSRRQTWGQLKSLYR